MLGGLFGAGKKARQREEAARAWLESQPPARPELWHMMAEIESHVDQVTAFAVRDAFHKNNDAELKRLIQNEVTHKLPPHLRDRLRLIGRGGEWATVKDMIDAGLTQPQPPLDSLILGSITNTQNGTDSILQFHGDGHLITIAPTGAGKDQGHIIPNLLMYQGPVVVMDPKGENYRAMGWRRRLYGKVFKWAPFEQVTDLFNPLDFVSNWDDARVLADLLIVSEGRADPFWDRSARDLLTGLILFVKKTKPDELQNMREVTRMVFLLGPEKENLLTELHESGDEHLVELAATIESWHEGMDSSIFQSLKSHLDIWRSPEVARATSRTSEDWFPADLFCGPHMEELMAVTQGGSPGPSVEHMGDGTAVVRRGSCPSVFVIVPSDKIVSYRAVIRVVIGTLMNEVMKAAATQDQDDANVQNAALTGLPKRRIMFVLDELPQLGYMAIIERAIAIARWAKIRLWLFVQDVDQLEATYPRPRAFWTTAGRRSSSAPAA